MNIGKWLFTRCNGTQVGFDTAGNRYFIERRARASGARLRRWVLRPRQAEAAPIPDAWQAWLDFAVGPDQRSGPAAAGHREP